MRLVLDTNVVVSAFVWGGRPYKLVQAAVEGEVELVISPELLAELRRVLAREHLASHLAKQRSSVDQAVGLYGELAISVSALSTPRINGTQIAGAQQPLLADQIEDALGVGTGVHGEACSEGSFDTRVRRNHETSVCRACLACLPRGCRGWHWGVRV